ncbi:hypothetical protein F751_3458 [Auxenochlorella protothecoides]|uniref:Uncharacterized protein n=1 Tax=Auxenochlorella protothecoides TaxID=3075 RepID=A0A087SC13_AUXPR|nr:hypothetical protein F751_3458 [Auxenochlorella protothecoides]KFM23267.1 hypothetical protein F751_3458 [Auxenochlorella protothecoides]
MPRPWLPASGFRMKVESGALRPGRSFSSSAASRAGSCSGSSRVRGMKSYRSGMTWASLARLRASPFFRVSSAMPGRWLLHCGGGNVRVLRGHGHVQFW